MKLHTPEAAPNAETPQDKESADQFIDRYLFVVFQIYDNSINLPLQEALKQIYSVQSMVPRKTMFELMEPNLQLYNDGLHDGLIFTGSLGETPQKSFFLSHKNYIFVITLYGRPDARSNYSTSAEQTFDEPVPKFSTRESLTEWP
jgi:hypothetical protein